MGFMLLHYVVDWNESLYRLGIGLGVGFPSKIKVHHLKSPFKWLPPGPTKIGDWFTRYMSS